MKLKLHIKVFKIKATTNFNKVYWAPSAWLRFGPWAVGFVELVYMWAYIMKSLQRGDMW